MTWRHPPLPGAARPTLCEVLQLPVSHTGRRCSGQALWEGIISPSPPGKGRSVLTAIGAALASFCRCLRCSVPRCRVHIKILLHVTPCTDRSVGTVLLKGRPCPSSLRPSGRQLGGHRLRALHLQRSCQLALVSFQPTQDTLRRLHHKQAARVPFYS